LQSFGFAMLQEVVPALLLQQQISLGDGVGLMEGEGDTTCLTVVDELDEDNELGFFLVDPDFSGATAASATPEPIMPTIKTTNEKQ
jgi:hypothetical protein